MNRVLKGLIIFVSICVIFVGGFYFIIFSAMDNMGTENQNIVINKSIASNEEERILSDLEIKNSEIVKSRELFNNMSWPSDGYKYITITFKEDISKKLLDNEKMDKGPYVFMDKDVAKYTKIDYKSALSKVDELASDSKLKIRELVDKNFVDNNQSSFFIREIASSQKDDKKPMFNERYVLSYNKEKKTLEIFFSRH